MPLDLHPKALVRLKELLISALPTLRVQDNTFLDYQNVGELLKLDAALPDKKDPLRRRLEA
ncbi:MAG: hypothetical protein ACJ8DC_06115, partial [Gemmatimonadales bacterium]